tara:strand:+ start:129 stop:368 length:240 start_codon:yes stop_codon:yes gene_type:complete
MHIKDSFMKKLYFLLIFLSSALYSNCYDLTTLCADASNCNTIALNSDTGEVYYNFTDGIAGVQFNITGGTATSGVGGAA